MVFQGVSISGITIENSSSFAFWGLPWLEDVYIMRCQLKEAPDLSPISNTLRKLTISKSNLTYIPGKYFNGCTLLYKISLPDNLLTSVPNFRGLNAILHSIILRNNLITSVEPLYFFAMTELSLLDLSSNLIVQIGFGDAIWPAISVIDLSNNCITSIDIYKLKNVSESVYIHVRGNPWHCDRELCWLSRCNFRTGARPDLGWWANCSGVESIHLQSDFICKTPDGKNCITINEAGNDSITQGILRVYHMICKYSLTVVINIKVKTVLFGYWHIYLYCTHIIPFVGCRYIWSIQSYL